MNLFEIKRLILDECANFQRNGPWGIKDFCWMKEKSNDGKCLFFTGKGKCKYFEYSVLPLDPELEEEYINERIEIRKSDLGESLSEGVGDIKGFSSKVQIERVSISKNRR